MILPFFMKPAFKCALLSLLFPGIYKLVCCLPIWIDIATICKGKQPTAENIRLVKTPQNTTFREKIDPTTEKIGSVETPFQSFCPALDYIVNTSLEEPCKKGRFELQKKSKTGRHWYWHQKHWYWQYEHLFWQSHWQLWHLNCQYWHWCWQRWWVFDSTDSVRSGWVKIFMKFSGDWELLISQNSPSAGYSLDPYLSEMFLFRDQLTTSHPLNPDCILLICNYSALHWNTSHTSGAVLQCNTSYTFSAILQWNI